MQHFRLDSEAFFVCSFDISSLFTNIPVKEIPKVCADSLYNREFIPPTIDKALFTEILTASTISVKFSFNNAMHKQIDRVAMGSPFGPALAIFVEYCEEELL